MKDNYSYILVNGEKKTYTNLNRFIHKKSQFEGEYSLLHNAFSNDAFFLSKFLFESREQPLYLINSQNDEYQKAVKEYTRYLEEDVSKYIEEKQFKEKEQTKDVQMDKNLGQLQLSIVKGMIEKQLESVRNQSAKDVSEHQVLIGKELALQWAMHMIQDIVEKGH